nr:ribonuclease H-like domain-containing protein [Tanacetum cinerariifolium]
MVFMAQIKKVLSDSEASSSSADEKISEIADQQVLFDKMTVQLVESDKHVRDLKNTVLEKDFKISELEECVRNKDLEIEKCLERLNVCENKLYEIGQTNQTVHMIMPSKDNLYNGRKDSSETSQVKPLYLLHMDLCGSMRIQSINGKQYVLVVVDDYLWYTWVFFLHSKDEASEVIISFNKKTQVNLQLQVQHVRTDNGTEFKNKTLAKFFDEIDMIIEYLDLEPKIDAIVRDFLEWKELSRKTSSKILPIGDGSRGETLNPIARLVLKGKLK